uniref:Putative secreted protein n=1 Tax=Ixodes ricinus TaxID=34613 RepID=A0A6B0U7Z2_IXORI
MRCRMGRAHTESASVFFVLWHLSATSQIFCVPDASTYLYLERLMCSPRAISSEETWVNFFLSILLECEGVGDGAIAVLLALK